jgi:hypothetical protein
VVKNEVDEAFEWLVVILGVVTAILVQYPEYFYTATPGQAAAPLKAAMAVIPPIVVTVVVWLVGKLSERDAVQAVAKVVAWQLILSVTWANLYSYFLGISWAASGVVPGSLSVGAGMLGFLLLGPTVTFFVVVPKYGRMYPGVLLLRSKWRLMLLCVGTLIVALFLTVVITYMQAG